MALISAKQPNFPVPWNAFFLKLKKGRFPCGKGSNGFKGGPIVNTKNPLMR